MWHDSVSSIQRGYGYTAMNIHLINNNQSFQNAVSSSLRGYRSKLTGSAGVDDALAEIQKNNADIVLINWSRSDFDIAVICGKIRKLKHHKYIYIMVVLTREREDEIEDFMAAGADDFIFKPFGKYELLARVRMAVEIIKVKEDVVKNKKKIIKMVKEDPVTGLLNRRTLMDEVLKEMGRASRELKYISALMINISNFKALDEKYGNQVMDQLLEELGRRMKKSCRPYDKIGRYGIADFLLFLPDSVKNNAVKVARRMMSSIIKKPFILDKDKIDFVLVMGISELDPKEISKNNSIDSNLMNDLILDALIKKSEIALKIAHRHGGSKIEVFMD